MAITAEAEILAHQFNEHVARMRLSAALAVLAMWQSLTSHDADEVPGFLAAVVPFVRGTQQAVVAAVDAYLATFVSLETGVPVPPVGLDPSDLVGAGLRRGVEPDEVYRRPFVTVWSERQAGKPNPEALDLGRQRLDAIVWTDVMLAHREATSRWMQANKSIVGYRRVLSGTSCGLCAVAATQRYHVAELMPIHGRCDCTVEPIVGNVALDRVLNNERFLALKTNLGSNYSDRGALARERVEEDGVTLALRDLPKVRVAEHGELGPVLVDADHAFMGRAAAEAREG